MNDLAAIQKRHVPSTIFGRAECATDDQPWPCDTAQVLDEVSRLRNVMSPENIARVAAETNAIFDRNEVSRLRAARDEIAAEADEPRFAQDVFGLRRAIAILDRALAASPAPADATPDEARADG